MKNIKQFDWSITMFRTLETFKKQFAYFYSVFTGEQFIHFTVCRCMKLIRLWYDDHCKKHYTGFEQFYYKSLPLFEYCLQNTGVPVK